MMNVGIIGCAGHYGLALDSADNYGACLVRALALPGDGTDDAALRIISQKRNIPLYDDWQKMLETEKLDLIVVDNRYDLHASLAARCLKAGFHVYCEKPLATELNDLAMLERTYLASGKALGGMFNLRYSGWFLSVKTAIDAGEIGKVRLIHGQKSYKFGTRPEFFRHRAKYGGMIPWVAIHALDWCLALGGDCKSVSALQSAKYNAGHGETEMTAAVLMELEDEVIATVTADYLRPAGGARHDDDRIRVTGTKGMIEVIDGAAYIENEKPRRALPAHAPLDPLGEFMRAIENDAASPFAESALKSTRAALLARLAADEKRAIRV